MVILILTLNILFEQMIFISNHIQFNVSKTFKYVTIYSKYLESMLQLDFIVIYNQATYNLSEIVFPYRMNMDYKSALNLL